jgi:CheY-like chemotaxis protein/HPt (histidine-containing phosphotransfer) domain-containing protein
MINQSLIAHILAARGYQVDVVGTGPAALAALARQAFDLVLMDVQMPELDGLKTTARIRAKEQDTKRHIPIVALTAHAMQGDAQRCLAAGMDAYLAKPLRSEDLYAIIDQLLGAGTDPHDTVAPAETPPIDLSQSLLSSVDKTWLATVVLMFQQDYPQQMVELRAALQARDTTGVARLAHQLGGVVSIVGATTARLLASQLEDLGRAGELETAWSVLQRLQSELERITAFYAELSREDCV